MFLPDLPKPVLFHPLKHHLGYIREFIRQGTQAAPAALKADLLTLGSSQLDLYTGQLTPLQLAEEVIQQLQHRHVLEPEAYRQFIGAADSDYQIITLADGTDWVLRWGVEAGRHVHLHPARYAANTIRVKANALKTAVAMVTAAAKYKTAAADLPLLNQVRHEWLGLPPVKALPSDEGAAKLVKLLKNQMPEA
ncbi:hypothetical protein [Botryobacter ruber]|uniref:hypothetical protein n=1 Tax=Botryobacter ruber TaxID=2171629 RepID=UPI000E0CBBB0|nr:hypothetical protein [Botryobacter ruber]